MTSIKLDEVLYTYLMTSEMIKGDRSFGQAELSELPRFISFDMKIENILTLIGKKIAFDSATHTMVETQQEVLRIIDNKIKETFEDKGLEFIFQDPVTRCVYVFSEKYVDRLVDKEEYLGTLALNYYRHWYSLKCGEGQYKTRNHHDRYNTFSSKEVDMLEKMYIPIAVVPKDLVPVHAMLNDLIKVSPLKDYVIKEEGYNVHGRKSEANSWWIPREIAKIYLELDSVQAVRSIRVLQKLLLEGGFLGRQAVEGKHIESPFDSDSKEKTDKFILDQSGATSLNNIREKSKEEEYKRLISADALVDDTKEEHREVELIELDWR